jgi:hypothetical protein
MTRYVRDRARPMSRPGWHPAVPVRPGQVPVLDTKVSGKSLHADPRVITYGKKSIALDEVEWVSYWATHTATRHYFWPTTHDSEWGFKVGRYPRFGGPKIAVRYDLSGRQDHAPDSWMFLANLARRYLEPRLLGDLVDRIRRGETIAVGGGVKVSQDGIACPKPRLLLPWHLIVRIQPYNGVVWIYQAGAEKPALTVPLSHPNAGLLPAIAARLTS